MTESVNRQPGSVGYVPPAESNQPLKKTEGPGRDVAGAGVAGGGTVSSDLPKIDQKDPGGSPVSKPEIPPPQSDKVDWSKFDAQSILAILGIEQNKRGIETSEADIKLTMTQQKEAADARLKAIEEATKKAEEARAKENSFWGKFCKVLSSLGSLVGGAVSFAMGAMLTASGVGAPFGVLLMAQGLSSIAAGVMDFLIGVGAIDDPGWRPTLSNGVTKALEAMGVDPKIAGFIGMGVEIAVVIVANVGAASAVASHASGIVAKGTSLAGVVEQAAIDKAAAFVAKVTLGSTATLAQIGSNIVRAGGDVGTQTIKIQTALLQYDSDMAAAHAEEIKAAIARLAKTLQMDMETIETLIKRIQANTEAVSDTVQGTAEANKSIAANMGGTAA